ncbi:hypothetical protein GALL_78470 [mine drainage metagenome]|uniref:Sirohydrochlorin cobaltochelatase n=1 Tax=mine drainage metagenome TaxID=410659 RepID=A0A1J5TCU0_9ZZZZ
MSAMTDLSASALLLVGHGSSKSPDGRTAACRLADALRRRRLFAEVEACFCRDTPRLSLDLVRSPTVFVVPFFSGEGLFTRRLIPEALGLPPCSAEGFQGTLNGRRIHYTPPVGAHPRLPDLLSGRALRLCRAQGLDPAATGLLLVAHGSSRPGGAAGTPERIAAALRAGGAFAEVTAAYIEQAPRVAAWPAQIAAADVIAAPLLISEGMHASRDLPPLFGLDRPEGGPASAHGRRVWLMGGIGSDPEIGGIVLDLVQKSLA